jgi:hypothetical protein
MQTGMGYRMEGSKIVRKNHNKGTVINSSYTCTIQVTGDIHFNGRLPNHRRPSKACWLKLIYQFVLN